VNPKKEGCSLKRFGDATFMGWCMKNVLRSRGKESVATTSDSDFGKDLLTFGLWLEARAK